jgi:hypothetical protein
MLKFVAPTARAGRACQTALGLLAAFTFMAPAAHARDVPDGWQVRAENNGVTYAPVRMNPGEKLEVWVANALYDVPQGSSPQSRLPLIRQQAGALAGDNGAPPEVTQAGVATQDCTEGGAALQYMLLPSRAGANKVQLLRIRAAGGEKVLARYKDGFQQTLQIVMQGQATTAPRGDGKPAAQPARSQARSPAQQASERTAQAIRTAPGQGVQDGDIAAIFVTEKRITNPGEQLVQRIDHTTWLLLKDGTGYRNEIPPDELNVKAARQSQPDRWVQWRKPMFGGSHEIRGPNDSGWRRLDGWIAQPARSGERLNSFYEHAENWGNMYSGFRSNSTTWHFSADGTFKISTHGFSGNGSIQAGGGFSVNTTRDADSTGSRSSTSMSNPNRYDGSGVTAQGGRRADDGASRRGRYRLKGWVLEAERDDGVRERHLVTFRRDKRDEIDIDSAQFFLLKPKK